MSDSRYKKLGANTLMLTIGSFSSRLLSFFLVPLYTHCLSTEEYGIADLVTVTVNLLLPFLTITASEGVLRFTLDKKNDRKQVFTIASSISFLGLCILFLVSPIILRITKLSEYSIYFILYYIFMVGVSICSQFVKGIEKMSIFVIGGVLSTFATIVTNILLLVCLDLGIEGFLISYIVGNVVQFLFLVVSCKLWRYIIGISRIDKKLLRSYLLYCIPLIPNSLSWWISNSSDRYMVSYFCGMAALGVYSVAYKIPSIVSIVSNIFTGAWQISAVENFGEEKSVSFFSDVYKKYSSIYVIGCSAVVLFIKFLARVLFANDFYAAWQCATVLTFAAVFQAMSGYLGIIYGAAMKTKQIFTTTLLGAGSNIILNFLLIPSLGSMGAAIATLLSYIFVWIARLISSRKFLPITINYCQVIGSYILVGVQIVVTIMSFSNSFFISGAIFALIVMVNREIIVDMKEFVVKKICRKA